MVTCVERKFTDEEIVKALGMCNYNADCDNCPCVGECWNVNKYAIDIINRQKTEIEKLREEREKLLKECKKCGRRTQKTIGKLQKKIIQAKTEVYKELAEMKEEQK